MAFIWYHTVLSYCQLFTIPKPLGVFLLGGVLFIKLFHMFYLTFWMLFVFQN